MFSSRLHKASSSTLTLPLYPNFLFHLAKLIIPPPKTKLPALNPLSRPSLSLSLPSTSPEQPRRPHTISRRTIQHQVPAPTRLMACLPKPSAPSSPLPITSRPQKTFPISRPIFVGSRRYVKDPLQISALAVVLYKSADE